MANSVQIKSFSRDRSSLPEEDESAGILSLDAGILKRREQAKRVRF
jgi:hypothetical protein